MLPGLLGAAFAPRGPLVVGGDDTIERRRGGKMRWTAQMAGAVSDAAAQARIGDEFAAAAPDLAAQAYAASFATRPAGPALRGWLHALARSDRIGEVAATAREGMQALRQAGRVAQEVSPEAAVAALEGADAEGVGVAIEELLAALAPPARMDTLAARS